MQTKFCTSSKRRYFFWKKCGHDATNVYLDAPLIRTASFPAHYPQNIGNALLVVNVFSLKLHFSHSVAQIIRRLRRKLGNRWKWNRHNAITFASWWKFLSRTKDDNFHRATDSENWERSRRIFYMSGQICVWANAVSECKPSQFSQPSNRLFQRIDYFPLFWSSTLKIGTMFHSLSISSMIPAHLM